VATWLLSKKADEALLSGSSTSFWDPWAEQEGTSLLGARKEAKQALDHQRSYRLDGDDHTVQALNTGGLTHASGDQVESQGRVTGNQNTIKNHILTQTSRFFILGLRRDGGGHSVGFMREWKFIGKSTTTYFFDPNFGEVIMFDARGLLATLTAIDDGTLYKNRYMKKHILHPFGY
jgi:hypothetical protein